MTDARLRAAVLDDAPALGRVMAEVWLAAHREQVPEDGFLLPATVYAWSDLAELVTG